jgi:hypothetical protein
MKIIEIIGRVSKEEERHRMVFREITETRKVLTEKT